MKNDISALWFAAFVLGVLVLAFVLERRNGRRVIKAAEAHREAERAAEAREAQNKAREEQKLATRRLARERARIAYPDLVDAVEADTDPIGPLAPYSASDMRCIGEAFDLVEGEIQRHIRNHPRLWPIEYRELEEVKEALYEALDFPKGFTVDEGRPSEHLGEPVRVIDCGEAGKIKLFTAAQVEAARDKSGRTQEVYLLQRLYDAPNLARRVLERAKAHEEQIEREKREAEEAVTTKLDDLPPLPPPALPKNAG
jgi:hypothetical protein